MQMIIFALIGLIGLALIVYLFSFQGKTERNSDPKRVEEQWVRSHGDAAMVNMYYKAHSDEERAMIVNFIHSTCPQEPGPNESAASHAARQEALARQAAQARQTAPFGAQPEAAPEPQDPHLFPDLEEDEEEAEFLLSRKERKALRLKEKEEKAAAREAAREAALAAAIAEANKVQLRQADSGKQEEYPDLNSALQAAISQAEEEPAEARTQPQPQPQSQPQAEPLPQTKAAESSSGSSNTPLCSNCGAELLAGCQFCIICGQATDAAKKNLSNDKPVKTSPGIMQESICSTCGAVIPGESSFCTFCGQPRESIAKAAPGGKAAENAALNDQ
ncbi:MAG: zinc ribbon domain-containing protein, partial [Bacillota bacterium]|nr:zinc ribbon domain-containing protein [Bacillota bacterium]